MRCKKHYADLSSNAGVCASCLRQRLFALILAQEQANAQNLDRNSNSIPAFPPSVSPYITSRKSDPSAAAGCRFSDHRDGHRNHHHRQHHHSVSDPRFYSTPQVGPSAGGYRGSGELYRKKKQGFGRFFLFSWFRSKNRNGVDADPRVSNFRETFGGGVDGDGNGNVTSIMSSPSWFSNVISGGDRRKKHLSYSDASSTTAARKLGRRDRGMSPVRYSDADRIDEFPDGSSEYDSSESWKQTPRRTPAVRRGAHARNVSGLAFCLSPLVRASPNRHCNQKRMAPPPDGTFSGEIRASAKPHLAITKSFCANRSRKLADFGRFNPNR